MYIKRALTPRVTEALDDTPVVLINGPRQSGKSTLAAQIAGSNREQLSFDDPATLAAAQADPVGFIKRLPEKVVLDEVQRVPELFAAIKLAVDTDRQPGRFLLAGSANIFTLPRLADSLAGRMEVLPLYPFAESELRQTEHSFLQSLYAREFGNCHGEYLGDSLQELVVRGGFPEALARKSPRRRRAWFNNYLNAIVQRDLRDISNIRHLDQMPLLLSLLASRTAHLLNISELANTSRIAASSLTRYVTLLENVFLIERLRPWSSNRTSQLTKQTKLHLVDTGLACALNGLTEQQLGDNRQALGLLLETFIYGEFRKQASWLADEVEILHFRDAKKREVDLVLTDRQRRLVGVEVKGAATVQERDFRGLKTLAKDAGKLFHRGIVLYDGERVLPFGDKLLAVPLSALWSF